MLPCFASLKQKPMDFQNYYLFPYVWPLVSVFKYIWDIRKKEQQMFFFLYSN
jgi:hypothetical protein